MSFKSLEIRTFGPGEVLFKEGDQGDEAFVIEFGQIEISREINGKRVVLATLGEDSIFGEMALVDDRPRSATATTVDRAVCFVLSKDAFGTHIKSATPLLQDVLKALVGNMRTLLEQMSDYPKTE